MRVASILLILTLGCSSEPAATPAVLDAAEVIDTAATSDSASAVDSASVDSVVVDTTADAAKFDILGTVSGECGGLLAELTKPTPFLAGNAITFVMSEKYVKEAMSVPDGRRIFETANAGGSSTESEVMSFELLHYCDNAALLKTETEILYAPPDDSGPNTITDILVSIGGKKVGVSVTRVYKPAPMVMTDAETKALLEKKLDGILRSSTRVLPSDKWVKQILHVFASTADSEAAVKRVLPTIDAAKRADTIVILTRTAGGGFLYCNPDPALGSECPPL